MPIDENEFFRQATQRICGELEFELALQKCLLYLKSFMPGDCFHLNLYDRELGILRTIAIATPTDAARANIVIPVNDKGRNYLNRRDLPPSVIIEPVFQSPFYKPVRLKTGIWKEHSIMVLHLAIQGSKLGNLLLFARGLNRFREEDLRLFSVLHQPFAIALSHAIKYDELNQLKEAMADDIRFLRKKLERFSMEDIIGKEFGLREVMDMVREVGPLDSPVLLQGETGVGKDIIAKAIHSLSRRKGGPFIQVNCGAIPETLIDSELFGHEKGAFTGALARKRGYFERADGGTIFLDEVAELPLQAQVRLLRILQDKRVIRVGGTDYIKLNIRIISATHQNLQEMVRRRLFRADLWFRLHVFPIMIPPLRERKGDIPVLIDHFIEKKSRELRMPFTPKLAPGSMDLLTAYEWPGNVRELENVVERALILSKGRPLAFTDIVWADKGKRPAEESIPENRPLNLDEINAIHISKVLEMAGGRINGPTGAAQLLGLHPSTLRHRMRRLGVPYGRRRYYEKGR